jgi:vacuolar-type H+-ATPase subunit E/Vma4
MTGSDLTTQLRERAEATAASILESAEADAERIAADADRTIEQRRRDVLRSHERKYSGEARFRIAAARHEATRQVLLARTRVVERVVEKARKLFPQAIQSDAYGSLLAREIGEAIDYVGGKKAVVRCTEALASQVRRTLEDRPGVSVEAVDDVGSGFIAIGEGGKVRVDATLETKLERLAPAIAIAVHQRLEQRTP